MNYNLNFPRCKKCHSVTFITSFRHFHVIFCLSNKLSSGLQTTILLLWLVERWRVETGLCWVVVETGQCQVVVETGHCQVVVKGDSQIQSKWMEQIIENWGPMPISVPDKYILQRSGAFILFPNDINDRVSPVIA